MDFLKKFFPISFKYRNSGKELAKGIIIQAVASLVISIVLGTVIGITAAIPAVPEFVKSLTSLLLGAVTSLVDIYATAGIVIEILVFLKVIKD